MTSHLSELVEVKSVTRFRDKKRYTADSSRQQETADSSIPVLKMAFRHQKCIISLIIHDLATLNASLTSRKQNKGACKISESSNEYFLRKSGTNRQSWRITI